MFQLTDIQKVGLTLKATDAKNNPAVLPTPPVWSVSDPAILAITPAVDGMSAEVAAVGPEGTAQVIVKADLGGGQSASGSLDIQVVGSAATTISVTPGAAEPITPTPTP